jgi:RimJ/RimL family protein N-acetyltransferase
VRVRRSKPDDWKYHKYPNYDSEERFFTDYEQELPYDDPLWQEKWENYINTNWNNEERICLAFETLDGEYVGGGNLHGINKRNGTFGIFFGADEERYAVAGAKLMLEYAFNELRLNNCHTGLIENDTKSQSAFAKLGFTLEGVRRQQVFHKGKYWNENLYGLLSDRRTVPLSH